MVHHVRTITTTMPNASFINSVQRLREAVSALPSFTPLAPSGGILYHNFKAKPSSLKGDLWEKTNQAYTRCFSSANGVPTDHILRGPFGMNAVVDFFEDFMSAPGISSGSLFLIEQIIDQITKLVYAREGHKYYYIFIHADYLHLYALSISPPAPTSSKFSSLPKRKRSITPSDTRGDEDSNLAPTPSDRKDAPSQSKQGGAGYTTELQGET